MKINVTHFPIWGTKTLLLGAALGLASAPGFAQENNEKPAEVVTSDTVSAGDVATTPIADLNLKKDPIPQILLDAQIEPYTIEGLRYCRQYVAAVQELDTVLGDDFDLVEQDGRKLTVGRVAQSVVGALIPFRGVIRELSGAAKHERQFQDAILAGMMRRAFLKGMGLKLGCEYPARPATPAIRDKIIAEREAALLAAQEAEEKRKNDKNDK